MAKAKPKKKGKAKPKGVSPIPKGFHSVTPYFVVKGASQAIDFYKRVFGAKERFRMPGPDGRVMHAELLIGDSILMLGDEMPEQGALAPAMGSKPPISFYLYVPDCDAVIQTAAGAGAKVLQPAQDMFWGDRYGTFQDPFGHVWSVATHKRDVSPEEMKKAAMEAMSKPKPAGVTAN